MKADMLFDLGDFQTRLVSDRSRHLLPVKVLGAEYAKADGHFDLVPGHGAVADVAPDLPNLEPVQVAQGLAGLGDGPIDGLLHSLG